ncbi:zinc transporter ZIP9-B isoform X2 [Denticeps clupeoides]|uniref:zinc transporter ZIP9-B isoform X2 n=1 Tax=Denticeps clupeoides TaxID=299321 RepID=UPI0010A2B487|nr:zinc transporter ZIP9-B-like isoform X2 [Denticeps clupeoides]
MQEKLQLVSVFGAGLLCGTALAIIIPEGVELMEDSWRVYACGSSAASKNDSDASSEQEGSPAKGLRPHFFIGLSLVLGFILMFVIDQISTYCSLHDPRTGMSTGRSVTATLGLIIHAAADGVALGAAVASSQVSVQLIVFFAVILHKAPAAFGLVSFLMHAGLERIQIQKYLLAFSAAAPVLAISTYFILNATGQTSQHRLSATGVGMLFSAGTFLYVAAVHVLPEISSRGQQHSGPRHQRVGSVEYQQEGLGLLPSATLVAGAALPVLLALGLQDD